jgi:hypothetical protein
MNNPPAKETEMQPEVIDGEAIEHTTEIVVREPVGGVLTVRDPAEMIAQATAIANQLQAVVEKAGLISNISGKRYPRVEAWTTLATLVGCSARTEWTHPVLDNNDEKVGWEAAVEVVNAHGIVVGRAEAQCLRAENNWRNRDDFALRSMAQTRATGKALRIPLGWIAVLAGYEATPAEEMGAQTETRVETPAVAQPPREPAAPSEPRMASQKQVGLIHALRGKLQDGGVFEEAQFRSAILKEYGTESTKELTASQASELIGRLQEAEKKL